MLGNFKVVDKLYIMQNNNIILTAIKKYISGKKNMYSNVLICEYYINIFHGEVV